MVNLVLNLILGVLLMGENMVIKLPAPATDSSFSVERAINERMSIRSYKDTSLTLKEISQLLWASQGIVASGRRASPSAGATYPLEIFLVAGKVEGLKPGLYKYINKEHSLELIKEGDLRTALSAAALGQDTLLKAPATLVVAAVFERTRARYGAKAERYVHMEAGHVGENIMLQATALGLGTVPVGAFVDSEVKKLLGIKEEPLYLFPVGWK
ncbi:MAG TPA: SagB/ThcOx family dehydrogenase [Candidatus Saccharicenans sp.]|nr:SagB/ThcOx family dehydrogenase [Candidatus Saccharicenans sp.]HQM74013.1 SagB/ThcOx family dehydrogenase [Candidatus Saccharicenans sp.]